MEPQVPGLVYVPGIDVTHYFSQFLGFFTNHSGDFYTAAQTFFGVLVAICIPLCVLFLFAIVITVEGLKKIRTIEDERFNTPVEPAYQEEAVDRVIAERWKKVVEHADSNNPNDWKQAIIDADVMLDNLVTRLGYRGESLGEKLKRSVKGDFKTRDAAWDAHLVRNRIAHDGSDFELTQFETKRVVALYREVFGEFYHISG